MRTSEFNYSVADSQATVVEPMAPKDFPFDAYADYEQSLLERCRAFWHGTSGVLVYRRMRVGPCFSYGCRDMGESLRWQLGGLAASMDFESDLPNFLEPWYGIGVVASAFGGEYFWAPGQPPAMRPQFQSVEQALAYAAQPVAATHIGRHTLRMIEYFIEQTGGRLPISLTDTQSPWNIAYNLLDTSQLMLELLDNPTGVQTLLARLSHMLVEFTHEQLRLIGESIVWPGHGFGSSRQFKGLAIGDDNASLVSDDVYGRLIAESFLSTGRPFGGTAFHSCGNWSKKTPMVRRMPGLKVVDAAFSPETDPRPNPAAVFRDVFAHTGIVVNARIVGSVQTITDCVEQLWAPGMRLIVVTYCPTPEEQAAAYSRIHDTCHA
jgi:hypothetical protein